MKTCSVNNSINTLGVDEMAIVFSYLPLTHILRARVCTTWREAARKAVVPPCNFEVRDARTYNQLRVMSTALPNLQQVRIGNLHGSGQKFSDGESPHQVNFLMRATYHTYDINAMSNFRKLKKLSIRSKSLNGIYPVLFNFPLLQSLEMYLCPFLKWDLSMLSGCPQLRKLTYSTFINVAAQPQFQPTGDLNNLRVLRNTLEVLKLGTGSSRISGNLMELADFPHLKELDLCRTSVTGDIRDIGIDDFPSIDNEFHLPSTVVGSWGYNFQRISDVPSFMESIHPLLKREHIFNAFFQGGLNWRLSSDSPDWYASFHDGNERFLSQFPFSIDFVRAGSRLGWRWYSNGNHWRKLPKGGCEINWLDPEPSRQSNDYDAFIDELMDPTETDCFRGYYQPPAEEECIDICNEFLSDQR